MPNTKSAKKAIKSSSRKRQFNTLWKNRIKASVKEIKRNLDTKGVDVDILNKELMVLQKTLDKASKKKVIHKNKANRLKSKYARKISAHNQGKDSKADPKAPSKKSRSAGKK